MNNSTSIPSGTLFLVATPIGNLQDITLRAIEVLKLVHYVAAEDTRKSRVLLNNFGINKPLISLHAHNENERTSALLEKLLQGSNIALISDAGTPLISDPGAYLVQEARKHKISVTPIPGPCAAIAALSASGIPCNNFFFFGFLPPQSSARRKVLETFQDTLYPVVFYEAPHRILALLDDIKTVFESNRLIGFAKEITKQFEYFFSGSAEEAIAWINEEAGRQKGEFVVILAGKSKKIDEDKESGNFSSSLESLLKTLLKSLPLKQAVQLATEISGEKKNTVYALALKQM
jgi:16S rRNA (cytidine1402-2'-O)-methyltransferase